MRQCARPDISLRCRDARRIDDRALPVGLCGGDEEEDIASVYLGEGQINRPPYDSRLIRLQGVGPVKVENRIAGGP
jgi:hypothetical protein